MTDWSIKMWNKFICILGKGDDGCKLYYYLIIVIAVLVVINFVLSGVLIHYKCYRKQNYCKDTGEVITLFCRHN